MQYTCEVCGGKGKIDWQESTKKESYHCQHCHGTGQKQITISLEEYDRLKKRCVDSGDYCEGCARQAILSYGKEDGEK